MVEVGGQLGIIGVSLVGASIKYRPAVHIEWLSNYVGLGGLAMRKRLWTKRNNKSSGGSAMMNSILDVCMYICRIVRTRGQMAFHMMGIDLTAQKYIF